MTWTSECNDLNPALMKARENPASLENMISELNSTLVDNIESRIPDYPALRNRRSTGDVDFYRDWDIYKRGFGNLDTDFWLRNENIHIITSSGEYELSGAQISGSVKFAVYDRFSLAGESDNYRITLGKYSGTAGGANADTMDNSLVYDRDNDIVW
ncbi:hypothetical protein RRG08_017225 [Elysia crispata]|uniref:Fibrinogen C-terminal domain-containing protein n=1 Tax=Elysia crispata TaxID=231223 RepID=A0AAE0Y0A8_9GAST|nr:hypothetical protein RRG08_017225 [Elysia crispata]